MRAFCFGAHPRIGFWHEEHTIMGRSQRASDRGADDRRGDFANFAWTPSQVAWSTIRRCSNSPVGGIQSFASLRTMRGRAPDQCTSWYSASALIRKNAALVVFDHVGVPM